MTQPRLLGDRYELEGVVGRGGMAEVYRARDLRLDRVVAIKTLRTDLARDATFQARFRREAQSAASLNNPTIVAVYDTGEDMSSGLPVPFIVMEYVDGRTVRDLLIEGHRLLPERTLEIVSGVLRALEYSHQAGIVHRDIKPGNVMVTRNGEVKVMDFGIARAMSDAQSTMTQTAQVIGTAQYLSPEQARGERVDSRSDLYSTGCLMYELLTGRPPFTGDSPVAIAYQHVRENPIPPSQLDPSLPRWADAIVLKAMAKSANDRYQSAAEMQADIQRAASGMQVAAVPPPQTRADYYDYQQRTQRMGPQTMMGAAATSVTPYQQGGYQTGYQEPYPYNDGNGGNGNGDGDQRRGRRWIPWTIAGVVALAAIIVAIIMLQGGGGNNTDVPLVDQLTQQQAVNQMKAAGLNYQVIPQESSTVNKGIVIKTSPAGGSAIAKNQTVGIYVSAGVANISLPDVTHLDQVTATKKLTDLGFQVTPQTDVTSTFPLGQVDRMSPNPGTSYPPGTQVTLFVSGGAVAVPDVSSTGLTQAEAQAELSAAGFTQVSFQIKAAGSGQMVQPGTCYFQTPAAGTVKPTTTQITVFVQPQQATTAPSASVTPSDTTSSTPTATASSTPSAPASSTPTDSAPPTPTDSASAPGDGNGNGNGNGNGGGNGGGGGGQP
jgi:eukaryotic-like serine/threonine-protein kinase